MKNVRLKNRLKRDGPLFLFSGVVKVAGDERTIMAIVAPRRGETNCSADPPSGRTKLPKWEGRRVAIPNVILEIKGSQAI
jgi:hypothetical protein